MGKQVAQLPKATGPGPLSEGEPWGKRSSPMELMLSRGLYEEIPGSWAGARKHQISMRHLVLERQALNDGAVSKDTEAGSEKGTRAKPGAISTKMSGKSRRL